MSHRWSLRTFSAALLLALAGAGCFKSEEPPPPPPAPPARTTTAPGPGPAPGPAIAPPTGKTVAGGVFNKLFPKDGEGYNVVFAQEKKGFAMADVMKGGKKIAQLSVSDITANPSAIQKYQSSTTKVGSYPSVAVGSQGTAVLVGSRYQVQARSTDPSFSAQDRETWLQKFDLSGLAQIK